MPDSCRDGEGGGKVLQGAFFTYEHVKCLIQICRLIFQMNLHAVINETEIHGHVGIYSCFINETGIIPLGTPAL